jgi:hypothetical protein
VRIRKAFFFEKKKQKTFGTWWGLAGSVRKGIKVFGSFLKKSTSFRHMPRPPANPLIKPFHLAQHAHQV